MSLNLKQIEAEVLQLPESERARLVKSLLLSLGEGGEEDVEGVWADEAERRYQEIASGEVIPLSSDEVMAEARARLK